jgi:hypothetical protein
MSYGCSGTGTVPLGQQRLYLLEQMSHSAVKVKTSIKPVETSIGNGGG